MSFISIYCAFLIDSGQKIYDFGPMSLDLQKEGTYLASKNPVPRKMLRICKTHCLGTQRTVARFCNGQTIYILV